MSSQEDFNLSSFDRNLVTWERLRSWIAAGSNNVQICVGSTDRGHKVISRLHLNSSSTLGMIALNTGGLVIDNGWIKLLGSGCSSIQGDLLTWNILDDGKETFKLEEALLMGYDVLGGFFAVNGRGISSSGLYNVFYRAPDTLRWEDCEKDYLSFIYWLINGDLNLFYEGFRWPTWQHDVKKLEPDEGFLFDPPIWQHSESPKRRLTIVEVKRLWQLMSISR